MKRKIAELEVADLNNLAVSLLSDDRKPQMRFLGNHRFGVNPQT